MLYPKKDNNSRNFNENEVSEHLHDLRTKPEVEENKSPIKTITERSTSTSTSSSERVHLGGQNKIVISPKAPPKYPKPKLLSRKVNPLLNGKTKNVIQNVDYNSMYKQLGQHKHVRAQILTMYHDQHQTIIKEASKSIKKSQQNMELEDQLKRLGNSGIRTMNSVINRTPARNSKEGLLRLKRMGIFVPRCSTPQNINKRSMQRKSFAIDINAAVRTSFKTGKLDLHGYQMETIDNRAFNTLGLQLGRLTNLDLRMNKLNHLSNTELGLLKTLTEIHVGYNNISHLPPSICTLTKLKYIQVDNNCIEALPDAIGSLVHLEILEVQNNKLKHLPLSLGECTKLVRFNVSSNLLEDIPYTISNLKKLKRLDLSRNCLTSLSLFTFLDPSIFTKKKNFNADDWIKSLDPRSKTSFYINNKTGEAVRDLDALKPSSKDDLWDDWRENDDFDDTTTNINTDSTPTTKKLSFGRLQEARKRYLAEHGLKVWDNLLDDAGNLYFVNSITGETTWECPNEIDLFGQLVDLEYLNINLNSMKVLPESIGHCDKLKVLKAEVNHLTALPNSFSKLKQLEVLEMNSNRFTELPEVVCECTSLTRLKLNYNSLGFLTGSIGKLVNIESLWVAGNKLIKLPVQLMYLSRMTELHVYDNPLKFPSYDLCSKGIKHIIRDCKERYRREVTGKSPPKMFIRRIGIQSEVYLEDPKYRQDLRMKIKESRETKSLHLFHLGLREIPVQVYSIPELYELRIVGNDIESLPEKDLLLEMQSLSILNLRNNKICRIPKQLGRIHTLTELILQDNRIDSLPDSVCSLRNLKVLRLSNNRLKTLPTDIGRLKKLTELLIDCNKISVIPESFSSCVNLTYINANRNAIEEIPTDISKLKKLKTLYLNQNRIQNIPDNFAKLPALEELRISSNQIKIIPESFSEYLFPLQLKRLWLYRNQIVELPETFDKLKSLEEVRLDMCPIRSPPIEIINKGILEIIDYCEVRKKRITAFKKIIKKNGFDFDESQLTPTAKDVLVGDTGKLTEDDLRDFDKAVDELLNSDFYNHSHTAMKIVHGLSTLFDVRWHMFRSGILNELIKLINTIQARDMVSEAYFDDDVEAPWGLDGEKESCFGIDLDVLFDIADEEGVIEELRKESLEQGIKSFRFNYTQEEVEDALSKFEGPYGHVGSKCHKVEFLDCECVDGDGDDIHHDPCIRKVAVIQKLIYTEEEAHRRERETAMEAQRAGEAVDKANTWYTTKLAMKRLKAATRRSSRDNQKMLKQTQKELKLNRKFLALTRKHFIEVSKKKEKFEMGAPIDYHNFTSLDAANIAVDESNDKYKDSQITVSNLEKEIEMLTEKLNQTDIETQQFLKSELERRLQLRAIDRVVEEGRLFAYRRKLRRPWDGIGGRHYNAWKMQHHVDEAARLRLLELETELDEDPNAISDDEGDNDISEKSGLIQNNSSAARSLVNYILEDGGGGYYFDNYTDAGKLLVQPDN